MTFPNLRKSRQTRKKTFPTLVLFPAVLLMLFSVACTMSSFFAKTYRSPEIASHQGYTTDGTYNYMTNDGALYKCKNDAQWSIVAENKRPFMGLFGKPDHLGDLDYQDGKLYVPAERFSVPCHFKDQQIAVYNADDLSLLNAVDVSAQGAEISGVAVVPGQNLLYVASYCDGSKLWKYKLPTITFTGTLNLEKNIPDLQGITWDGNRFLASSSEGNRIYIVGVQGTVQGPVLASEGCEAEGLKWHNNSLRWLVSQPGPPGNCLRDVDHYVYFYLPLLPFSS